MSSIDKPPVHRVIILQFAVLAVFGAALFLVQGWVNAYSFLLGGLVSAAPNAWFIRRFFRHRGARATGKIMRDFYTGKAIMLVLMGTGFALTFVYVDPLNVLAFFSGFILTHIAGLVLLIKLQEAGQYK